jgi:glucose-6-phosphate dehydrogenase-like protein OpcA
VAAALATLPAEGGADHRTCRASVMNLVVWADDPGEAAELEAMVDHLADHSPSRALIVSPGDGPDGIDAHVIAHRRPSTASDHHPVQVEQVGLVLRGAVAAHAASVVLPLLRPDLPTFLLWPRAPDAEDRGYEQLAGLAGRVVTEAARDVGAADALPRLARAVEEGGPAITDLAWAAITPWRQLLMQTATTGGVLRLAEEAATAGIAHPGAAPTVEALLLGGWLQQVLGDGLAVWFNGRPDGDEGVLAMDLEAADGRRILAERIPGRTSAAVTLAEPGREGRRRVLPLPRPGRRALLAGELEMSRRDRPFEGALAAAVGLAA